MLCIRDMAAQFFAFFFLFLVFLPQECGDLGGG